MFMEPYSCRLRGTGNVLSHWLQEPVAVQERHPIGQATHSLTPVEFLP